MVLGLQHVLTHPCVCLLRSGRRFCMLHFIYCYSLVLWLAHVTQWLEGSRESVGVSPANPAELVISHHCWARAGGLSLKRSCSVRRSWCLCVRHDGDETACPCQAVSLGRKLQPCAFLPVLGWGYKPAWDKGCEVAEGGFPVQAEFLVYQLSLDYFFSVEVDHWLGTWAVAAALVWLVQICFLQLCVCVGPAC